jgi:hypothetical protein
MTSIWKQHESPKLLLEGPLGRSVLLSRIALHWPRLNSPAGSLIVFYRLLSDLTRNKVDILAKSGQQVLLPELLQFLRIKLTGFLVVLGGHRHSLVMEEH